MYFISSRVNSCKHQFDVSPLFTDKPSLPSIGPGVTAASSGVMVGPDGNVESFIEDHKTRADNDPSAPPFDDLRNYAYEGGGSTAGSLSSLGSGKEKSYNSFSHCVHFWLRPVVPSDICAKRSPSGPASLKTSSIQ